MFKFWVLTLLAFCGLNPSLSRAQAQSWGDWKSDTKYEGIQIRARCLYYISSENVSDWNYQIRSTYTARVYVSYRDENRTSSPEDPFLGTDRMHLFAPREESPIYDDYVTGSCDRGGVRVAITNVEPSTHASTNPSVNETLAVSSSQVSAYYQAHRSDFSGRSLSDPDVQRDIRERIRDPKKRIAHAVTASTPVPASSSSPTAPPPQKDGLIGVEWACRIVVTQTIREPYYSSTDSSESKVVFASDGTASITGYIGFNKIQWKQDGKQITMILGDSVQYDLQGLYDANSIVGRVALIRYPSHSDNMALEGTLSCKP